MITISTPIEKKREEFNYENTNEKKSVHIIFGIDDLFVEPMAICVLSLLYHNQELKFVIHVISSLQLLSRLLIAPSQCLQSLEQCA